MSESVEVARRFQPYTNRDEVIEEICDRLAAGESFSSIARDSHMPGWATLYAWRDSDTDTADKLRRAREAGEYQIAHDATLIVDGLLPVPGVPSDPTRDRARADIRLKLLARMSPKRWGESTQLRHADADGQKLDTQPLVGELLSLMGQGVAPVIDAQPAAARSAPPAPIAARQAVTYREVRPAPAPVTQPNARPAYRPRVARDVDDLV